MEEKVKEILAELDTKVRWDDEKLMQHIKTMLERRQIKYQKDPYWENRITLKIEKKRNGFLLHYISLENMVILLVEFPFKVPDVMFPFFSRYATRLNKREAFARVKYQTDTGAVSLEYTTFCADADCFNETEMLVYTTAMIQAGEKLYNQLNHMDVLFRQGVVQAMYEPGIRGKNKDSQKGPLSFEEFMRDETDERG